ncbi:MAG: ABC transporter ATP-binding protein [Streptosporangiaceae bacterium]
MPRAPVVPLRVIFRRFAPYARPHRGLIAAALALAIASPLLATISIGFFKVLVDRVLVPRDLGALWWVALGYAALTAVAGAVGFGRQCVGTLAGERFVLDLRRAVFDRLQLLSLSFFERRGLGDIIARATGDIAEIERLVVSGVFRGLSYLLRILFFTVALFYLRWELALASLIAVPVFGAAARSFSRRIKEATREQRRRSGALSAVVAESLANIPLVQAYNRQDTEAARLDTESLGRFRARMAATRLRATFAPLVDGIELIGTLIVVALGTYELAQGRISLGGLLAFAAYLTQLYSPVRSLGRLANTAYAASAGAERVLELLDERPAVVDRPRARALRRARGRLELDHVSFRYPGAGGLALRDVSFTAERGQVVALVGASGAGKSTLVKLLLRFYDPDAGAVRLDGHDLRDLTIASLRDNLAVLLQETLVFDGTIGANIAYGHPGADVTAIMRAAMSADVHDFAVALPDGYDTVIGQRGRRLSGGQRQRVAIARAMVRDAPVLVLDEPTAGLDGETRRRVLDPLHRLMTDRTTILISHDLSTAREADTILVLDRGRVVEHGDHATLLARCGGYARMYEAHAPERMTAAG